MTRGSHYDTNVCASVHLGSIAIPHPHYSLQFHETIEQILKNTYY